MILNLYENTVEIKCSLDQIKNIYIALFKQLRSSLDNIDNDIDNDDTLLRLQIFLQKIAKEQGVDVTIHADWENFLGIKDSVCRIPKV